RDRGDRQARRAAPARNDDASDAQRADDGDQRVRRFTDAREDRVLPRHHFVRIPGGALIMDRRQFLQGAGAVSVLSVRPGALAQAAADYKALVCVFLYGGNDGNNTIVPADAAGYAQYSAVRTAASGLQIAQASLVPITPVSRGTPYGFHPSCAELATLFNQRKLAVMCNVGTLVQPTSK